MSAFSSTASASSRVPVTDASTQRVTVNLNGRLMLLTSQIEYDCKAVDMSPADVAFQCTAFPPMGERIVAYVDHIGRLECTVIRHVDHGFVCKLHVTDRKREKLAAQLTWLSNKHKFNLPEIESMGERSGFRLHASWTDEEWPFTLALLDTSPR